MSYPSAVWSGKYNEIPTVVDREVTVDEVIYDLVGAVYGVTRYCRDGKVFEDDGMAQHSSSTKHKKRRAALFAGHIGGKIGGKRVTDIYYTRRI